MRVIKIFFLSLLAIILLGGAFVLVGREIFLLRASSDIKRAYNLVRKNSKLEDCQDGFAISDSAWGQVRFISDSEYNLETVCSDFTSKPVLKEEKKLPVFVKKTAGASGFEVVSEDIPQYITLSALGRQLHIYLEEGEMKTTYGKLPELDYDLGPESVCGAFNGQCCVSGAQLGVGEGISQATDCPKSCHYECQPAPLILSFNARPVPNEQRLVTVRKGQAVTFSYVVSDGKQELFAEQVVNSTSTEEQRKVFGIISNLFKLEKEKSPYATPPITVRLDFGDGSGANSQSLQEEIEHVYTCATASCYYEVKLTATDGKGAAASESELSKLVVKVQ